MLTSTSRTAAMAGMLIALWQAPASAAAGDAPEPELERSVVKIFTTSRGPDAAKPWTRQSPRETTGSGVVIEGQRILTNAHVVAYASQVQVQGSSDGNKFLATVEAIAPTIDLAVLKIEDPGFFASHPPLPRSAGLPTVKDNVLVYGFPTGGALSITKGIVSRIEFTGYQYPTTGMRIQIDAAVNPGNSGGPALVDDRMIGIAFAVQNNTQNIAYIIPSEEIDIFLKDVADGRYDGKPTFFDDMQTLENPALRTFLKVPADTHGLVVRAPNEAVAGNPLREWDVVTRIGDTPIDDQGMIRLESGLRVRFRYQIQKLPDATTVPLTVIRQGAEMKLKMPLVRDRPRLIPDLNGTYPPYFIYGPIAFSKVTGTLAASLASNLTLIDLLTKNGNPIMARRSELPSAQLQELVVVAGPYFPHRLTAGYASAAGNVVESINGKPVRSLNHLVELLRDLQDEFVVIRIAPRLAESLVFPRKEMLAATEDILRDNGIREQGTPEQMALWQKR